MYIRRRVDCKRRVRIVPPRASPSPIGSDQAVAPSLSRTSADAEERLTSSMKLMS